MATVLIVDDEPPIVDLLCEVVREAGHVAVTAYNGLDALRMAAQLHPALIISDVMMPMLDGFGLLQALRSDPTLAHTMVVLLSAAAQQAQVETFAVPFVPKPIDLDVIEGFLRSLPL